MSSSSAAKIWWTEHSQSLCRLGEVFLSFGSGVLTIVCFGSPFWIEEDNGEHRGLWQKCSVTPTKCGALSEANSVVLAVRAMLMLALISGIIGWVVSMVSLVLHRPKFLLSASLAYGVQGLFLFIGLLSYTKEVNSTPGSHGWSYSIGWIGFFVSVSSSVTFLLVALYIYRNPSISGGPQVYAPLNQWEDTYSSDDSDDNL